MPHENKRVLFHLLSLRCFKIFNIIKKKLPSWVLAGYFSFRASAILSALEKFKKGPGALSFSIAICLMGGGAWTTYSISVSLAVKWV